MTFGLVGAIAYFSMLLNNSGKTGVTQIKKTKASAQTYHKLLALNEIPGGETITPTVEANVSNPTVIPALIAQNNITPTLGLQSTIAPTPVSTIIPTVTSIPTLIPTNIPPTMTKTPSPTVALLVYRTTTVTPTLIPVANTGGEQMYISPTVTIVSTKTPAVTNLPDDKLPETGWVQLSTILFIVATTTVFVSFLF